MKTTIILAAIFAFACAASARDYDYYRRPPGSPPLVFGRVEFERLRVFIPPQQFEHSLDVERMEDLCGDIAKAISEEVSEAVDVSELVVRVTLSKENGPEYKVSSNDQIADQLLQAIHGHLQKLSGMHSKVESLPFELHYKIRPKT